MEKDGIKQNHYYYGHYITCRKNILKKNVITLELLGEQYYKTLNKFNISRTVIIYPFFYLKNDGF